jgi:hypothetical protein
MNYKLSFLLFIVSLGIQAQEKKQNETHKIEINSKTKTLYVLGGITSVITKEDLEFAKKFNIKFHDFGCLAPINFEVYETKNKLVFEFLNQNFGKQWQVEIKPNVLGFEKWRKSNSEL